ncbi:MAG: hypothetical protein K2N53_04965, partial [Clostridia bacterium]|nr:hypothetical protein [Clostridia bacterium]
MAENEEKNVNVENEVQDCDVVENAPQAVEAEESVVIDDGAVAVDPEVAVESEGVVIDADVNGEIIEENADNVIIDETGNYYDGQFMPYPDGQFEEPVVEDIPAQQPSGQNKGKSANKKTKVIKKLNIE